MAPDTPSDKFVVDGEFLFVRGQLGIEDEKAYSASLFKLLNSGHERITVDFSALEYVSSSYIGATSLMVMMAQEKDVTPLLIVNEKIAKTFQMAGVDKLVEMKTIST